MLQIQFSMLQTGYRLDREHNAKIVAYYESKWEKIKEEVYNHNMKNVPIEQLAAAAKCEIDRLGAFAAFVRDRIKSTRGESGADNIVCEVDTIAAALESLTPLDGGVERNAEGYERLYEVVYKQMRWLAPREYTL